MMIGFLRPKRVWQLSEMIPTTGSVRASQNLGIASTSPSTAGFTPSTIW